MAQPQVRRRYAAAVVGLPLALAFAWASLSLSSSWGSPVTVLLLVMSLLHGGNVLCAGCAPKLQPRVEKWLGMASLSAALLLTGALLWTGRDMVIAYGPLGWGLAALLLAIGVLVLAATVPVGLWLLRGSRPPDEAR